MKTHFLSVGTNNYINSRLRIRNQIESINMIDHIHIYSEDDLINIKEFWEKHKEFVLSNKRGYGYWLWKSFLTLKTLDEMNDEDVLIYADMGCEILVNNKTQFQNLINLAKNDCSGFISFERTWHSRLENYIEKNWTKSDLFEYLNCFDLKDAPQLHATYFAVRKCEKSVDLVKQWYNISSIYSLLDDTPSKIPNDASYIEHRHDQSILSLLIKKFYFRIIKNEVQLSEFLCIVDSRIRN